MAISQPGRRDVAPRADPAQDSPGLITDSAAPSPKVVDSFAPRARAALKLLYGAFKPIKPLLWRPLLTALRVSNRQAGVILLYHAIAEHDGDGRRELLPAISRKRFEQHLDHLKRYYRLVKLSDLQTAVAARRRGDPFPVALTFDDDLGNHVTHALPALRDVDAPATFFLCGSFLEGPPRDYWWQRLQRAVDRGADVVALLGAGTIHHLGRKIEALSPERRDAIAENLLSLAGPPPAQELLTGSDARRLPHIGFHTVRHDRLTQLDEKPLSRALVDGRAGLAELAGCPIDTIAYPHGDFDSRVIEAAREHGFAIGLTCEREAVTPRSDPLALGRYDPLSRGLTGEFAFELALTFLISPSR